MCLNMCKLQIYIYCFVTLTLFCGMHLEILS